MLFLCYYLIYVVFQKLECLALCSLGQSSTALERFCEAMPNIKELYVSLEDYPKGHSENNRYDGVLRAIAANMPNLQRLDISYCTAEPKAIEYLLPTEDNVLGGCPELVVLNLRRITSIDVKLLKKIILALPKLRNLEHNLVVTALVNLTEEEIDVDTARSLGGLCEWNFSGEFENFPTVRPDVLANSPVFQRLTNNITNVYVQGVQEQKECVGVLKSLTKLRYLGMLLLPDDFIPILESIGDRLQHLVLCDTSKSRSVHDIIRTCPNLVEFTLHHDLDNKASLGNGINLHADPVEKLSKQPVLAHLTRICLGRMDKRMCSADMLIALLQSPNLDIIHLVNLEAMSDDVMFNVLSSSDCAALSKVTQFTLDFCSLVTAAPFGYWFNKENCSLQHISFSKCENIDCKILADVAEQFPRPLIVYISRYRYTGYYG